MEITIHIGYDQLLATIKKLPAAKIKQLKTALDDSFIQDKAAEELSDFQNFLLSGPVMGDKQFADYKANREHFNAWRTK